MADKLPSTSVVVSAQPGVALSAGAEVRPTYAGAFRCIGPRCEDHCCGDWDIPVDKITYQKYREFPAEKLGSLVANFVSVPVAGDGTHDNLYAWIRRKADGLCPFFGEDRLCKIQNEYGAGMLSSTCSIYPRALARVGGVLEGSLSLSCPEAARMVLLEEGSTYKEANLLSGEFRTDNVFRVRQHSGLEVLVLPMRALVTDLIRDRSRPVWQRLLLIASACTRLDALHEGDLPAATELLGRYRDSLGQGSAPELERLGSSIEVRLGMAIALSQQRCQSRNCGQRFQNVFWDFIEGIGSSGSARPGEDVSRFVDADRSYVAPLLNKLPFIMENYLLNYVNVQLFPFGRAGSDRFTAYSMSAEAVLLIAQYSWMTTLLTGVAARYGSDFNQSHLVTTVQAFTKTVEHVPQALEDLLAFVTSRKLDSLSGLSKLLRL